MVFGDLLADGRLVRPAGDKAEGDVCSKVETVMCSFSGADESSGVDEHPVDKMMSSRLADIQLGVSMRLGMPGEHTGRRLPPDMDVMRTR